jgi:hypothetical protein
MGMKNVLDALPDGSAGSDHLKRSDQPRLLPALEHRNIVGSRLHTERL